jgi:hypothetical protein
MPITLGILAQSRQAPVAAGSYDLIESVVLTSTTASVTFSGLAAYASTYKHLQLRMVARTNRGATGDDLSIQFNGDTGSNYTWHNLSGNGSSVTSNAIAISNTWMGNYGLAGGSTTSDVFSAQVTDILDPFAAKNKTIRSLSGMASNNNVIDLTSGFWNNTASLTEIRVFLRLGTSYVSGSRFSLYGLKG